MAQNYESDQSHISINEETIFEAALGKDQHWPKGTNPLIETLFDPALMEESRSRTWKILPPSHDHKATDGTLLYTSSDMTFTKVEAKLSNGTVRAWWTWAGTNDAKYRSTGTTWQLNILDANGGTILTQRFVMPVACGKEPFLISQNFSPNVYDVFAKFRLGTVASAKYSPCG
jgi:hypothetical protein